MSDLRARILSNEEGGQWRVYVYPTAAPSRIVNSDDFDLTLFRGAPTEVLEMSTSDPFGPATATLKFPKVSIFDRRGAGDLWWCVPEANVDIAWVVDGEVRYMWEGYAVSFEYGVDAASSSLTIQCVGALRQMDNYLATPQFLYAPTTFENAILMQFDGRPDLRLTAPRISWPSWWTKTFSPDENLYGKPWLIPTGVAVGQKWSGQVTRYTGQFEQALTGYIQQLLSSMHTDRGQFTLALDRGREPVLRHRDWLTEPNDLTLEVDLLWPGVTLTMTEDHTQKLSAVFVQGKTLSGVTFSGMQVTNDGKRTYYEPYAARRDVHPQSNNVWLNPAVMRKEVQLSAADGMSATDAKTLARTHLQRFSSPGYTGSLTINTDPMLNGLAFPRQAITAGMSVLVRSIFGSPDGLLFHITQTGLGADGMMSLTLDSKFRDQLTVQEVMLRGRDALTPTRMLSSGSWQPNVPDMLFPWSYEMGAGYVPWGSHNLFRGIGTYEQFPWVNWTQAHPPKDPQWRDHYVHIGPTSSNADENWSKAFPVLLSAAGSSRLVQVAAFDRDGNQLQVGFHFSLWGSNSIDATAGPVIPAEHSALVGYPAGQHHPFFPGAWETVDENGVAQNPLTPQAEATASLMVAWGNYYEQAGYWPSTSSTVGATPTGLFVDEVSINWDLTQLAGAVNPQETAAINTADMNRAMVYGMIYCEEQLTEDVYFLGRIYRLEPGTV